MSDPAVFDFVRRSLVVSGANRLLPFAADDARTHSCVFVHRPLRDDQLSAVVDVDDSRCLLRALPDLHAMCRRCIAEEFDLDACRCVLAVRCGVHDEYQRLSSDEARAAFEHRALDELVASVGGPDAIAFILSKHGMNEVVAHRRLGASFSVALFTSATYKLPWFINDSSAAMGFAGHEWFDYRKSPATVVVPYFTSAPVADRHSSPSRASSPPRSPSPRIASAHSS
jgi:hypothetical protein